MPARWMPARLASAQRQARQGAFTLVELLVALFVMALLAVLGSRALDSMVHTQDITRTRSDEVLSLSLGLTQWMADLDALQETQRLPSLDYTGRALRLTRRDAYEPDARRVVAWSSRAVDGKNRWLRWQSGLLHTRAELDTAWMAAALWAQNPDDAARRVEVVVADIDQWQLYYFRGGSWTNPLSSDAAGASTANAATAPGLPDGIRLELSLSAPQALSGKVIRDWIRPSFSASSP